jgi:hypothetical protein
MNLVGREFDTLLRRYHLVEKTGLSERECLFF